MPLRKTDTRVYAETAPRKKDNSGKRKILKSRLDIQRLEFNRRRNMLINSKKNSQEIVEPSDSMKVDTTTSAYGDAGKGRPVPKYGKFVTPPTPKKPEPRKNKKRLPPKENNYGQFSKGGEVCRGAGAAIKGTNFKGVF